MSSDDYSDDFPSQPDSLSEAELELRRLVASNPLEDADLEKQRRELIVSRSKEYADFRFEMAARLRPREKRRVLVQIPKATVPGGEEWVLRGRSSVVFRPTHLVVPRHTAPWFDVLDLKIGKNSQFAGEGGVPAACFAGDVDAFSADRDSPSDFLKKVSLDVPLPLGLDTVTPSHDISVRVLNLDACARIFHCVLYGTLVE